MVGLVSTPVGVAFIILISDVVGYSSPERTENARWRGCGSCAAI
jgi:hypothetical protein